MPEYLSPGVYVTEVEPRARPIVGVSTSTAAFIGVSTDLKDSQMPEKPPGTISHTTGKVAYTQADRKLTLTGAVWPPLPAGGRVILNGKAYDLPDTARLSDTVLELLANSNPGADIAAGAVYELLVNIRYSQVKELEPKLITSWDEFRQSFGDIQSANQYLAHAVYGFFHNGGSRCYVARCKAATGVKDALAKIAPIDEVALVAAPLPPETSAQDLNTAQKALLDHCAGLQDRFAILDSAKTITGDLVVSTAAGAGIWKPADKDGYGAFYFPWVQVADPLKPSALIDVPPSGHLAGVYARTDGNRGVFKAPANEELRGVLGLTYAVTKNHQNGLNVNGVNCLRSFYGNPLVWGARTVGSEPTYRYLNVRRYMNYLRESIQQGVRWSVFEPNTPGLWKRIVRTVSDFLLNEWRSGALFGEAPEQAFFVRCDKDTNRGVVELGQVVTEIGVAIVKPAEFVIFRIEQLPTG